MFVLAYIYLLPKIDKVIRKISMKEKKSFWKIGICICIVFASIFLGVYVCAGEEKKEWIEIVSVSPNHFENYTEPVTFTATIKYSLQSYERGIIYLGFNADKAGCYTYSTDPGDVRIVSQGNGTVKDFMIYAMLCKYP